MKHLILIVVSLIILQSFAQVKIDTTKYYDIANTGTLKQMTSKEVCAIVVFVSGPNNNWDLDNKKKILKRDKRAFNKLKKELKKFNIEFKIHFEIFNFEQDFKVDSIVNFKRPVVNGVKKSNRYKDANAKKIWSHYLNSDIVFFTQKQYLSYEGGYFMIMHHEGLGNTTASPATSNFPNDEDAIDSLPEFLTLFEYDRNYKKHNRGTVTHETLHLYGAWDLYNLEPYGFNKENYDRIKNRFPNSIMRLSNEFIIDPITAWRIGINTSPESWFLDTVPKAYHKSYYE